jgi:hypothetical protein
MERSDIRDWLWRQTGWVPDFAAQNAGCAPSATIRRKTRLISISRSSARKTVSSYRPEHRSSGLIDQVRLGA